MGEVDGVARAKGGGALRGLGETYQPNEFSGTASFSIPIFTSPCRDSAPHLALTYDSGGGNGIFGIGFDIALPKITRKTEHGIPEYDASDVFVLSAAADLVPLEPPKGGWKTAVPGVVVTRYQPTVITDFNRIEHWRNREDGSEHWRIRTPDNHLSVFGEDDTARITDGAGRLLSRTEDAHGNEVVFHYRAETDPDAGGHSHAAMRYPDRICYGRTAGGWLFEVVFDYGERDLDGAAPPRYAPDATWTDRPDPFSTYRPGFELRSRRLCRGVIMYHRGDWSNLAKPGLTPTPFAVHSTCFDYREATSGAVLSLVRQFGFHDDARTGQVHEAPRLDLDFTRSGPGHRGRLPPEMAAALAEGPVTPWVAAELSRKGLSLDPDGPVIATPGPSGGWVLSDGKRALRLTPAEIGWMDIASASVDRGFQALEIDGAPVAGLPQPVFVDLFGEGLPGILRMHGAGYAAEPHYARPLGGGRYDALRPIGKPAGAGDGAFAYLDQTFDGLADLVQQALPGAGYVENLGEDGFGAFRPFDSFPTEVAQAGRMRADLTGNGLQDVLIATPDGVRVYPARGRGGYGPPRTLAVPPGIAWLGQGARDRAIRFADVFGDGGAHLVEVRRASVRCWPNLGHGAFGAPVDLRDAPDLGHTFDPDRVRFADIDGSGTADLIYIGQTWVDLYRSLSGNGFAEAERIDLPSPCVAPSDVSFVDLHGTGTIALVATVTGPDMSPRTLFFDLEPHGKPHLLSRVDDMSGHSIETAYTTSTAEYLRARAEGDAWHAPLPFPVHVVARTVTTDHISKSRTVSRYRYRDGVYDAVRRKFRGFHQVDRYDSDDTITTAQAARHTPQLERSWFHTGEQRFMQWSRSAWQARSRAPEPEPELPGPMLTGFDGAHARAVDDAARALFGRLLRREIYALDHPGALEPTKPPLHVEMTSQEVRLVHDARDGCLPIYSAHAAQSVEIFYEDSPDDPRVAHTVFLDRDAFGHVETVCEIAYPRRAATGPRLPQQARAKYMLDVTAHCRAQDTAEVYLHGHLAESRRYAFAGEHTAPGLLGLADIRAKVADVLAAPDDASVEHMGWRRHYYWNETQSDPADLRQMGRHQFPHHAEEAVLSDARMQEVFDGQMTAAEMRAAGGYRKAEGYWWRRTAVQHFAGAKGRFLPLSQVDGLYGTASQRHDGHGLFVIETRDALGHRTRVQSIDPYCLRPACEVDENDVVTDRLLDPSGQMLAMSRHDLAAGGPSPLAGFKVIRPQDVAAILTAPDQALQGALAVTLRDRLVWQRERAPPVAVQIAKVSDTEAPALSVIYADGHGQSLQHKTAHGLGDEAFATSGYRVRDHNAALLHKSREGFIS